MAKPRKKKRTQPAAGSAPAKAGSSSRDGRAPKSMVIRMGAGEVGPSVSQLVKDVRKMMEPGTASRLRERKTNRLRDFTAMAGPLGVTHLLLFSRSASGNTNLRIALTPRGPTLHFHVERYALCKDVRKAQRRPRDGQKDYQTAPLLVMNNFLTAETEGEAEPTPESAAAAASAKQLESLTTTVFQSLFPAIAPQSTPLSSIRRVLLLDRETSPSPSSDPTQTTPSSSSPSYTLNLRHYAITTRATGVSRGIRKLSAAESLSASKRRQMPDLGRLNDIADYLLETKSSGSGGGYVSGSESGASRDSDAETTDAETDAEASGAEVEVLAAAATRVGRRPQNSDKTSAAVEKRAVKLVELGPRLRLRLSKIEEGVCAGRTMWHEYITKTNAETKALEKKWAERKKVKEERKRVQRENVERKKREKEERKKEKGEGAEDEDGDEDEDMDEDMEDVDDSMDDGFEDLEDGDGGEDGVEDA